MREEIKKKAVELTDNVADSLDDADLQSTTGGTDGDILDNYYCEKNNYDFHMHLALGTTCWDYQSKYTNADPKCNYCQYCK